MVKRCERNRKRSKRRAIHCPIHGCFLDSVSKKYYLYSPSVEQLRDRGANRLAARLLIAEMGAVRLDGEWIEAFWCDECQTTRWYHVRKVDRGYALDSVAKPLWEQMVRVIDPRGNPLIGEFTRSQALGLRQFSANSWFFQAK